MFFRDKLRHGPFPKLKTTIFIKIAKIIKNQIFENKPYSHRISQLLSPRSGNFSKDICIFLWDFLTKWPAQRENSNRYMPFSYRVS